MHMVLYPHHCYLLANTLIRTDTLILTSQQAFSFRERVRYLLSKRTEELIRTEIRYKEFILFSLLYSILVFLCGCHYGYGRYRLAQNVC